MALISFFLRGVIINIITTFRELVSNRGWTFFFFFVCCLLAGEMYCPLSQMPVSKILYMLASPATACVPPPRLCISEVCVCVSTWMYLNLLLFTPIVQLCLRGLLWSNWMSRGRGKPVAANAVPAGLIICNTAACSACAFSSAHEYRNECGGRQRWTQRGETGPEPF